GEAFAVGRDDDEAVGPGGRRQDGRAADGERLDGAIHQPHARVVETADRRADLAREPRLNRLVRPRRRPAAERANRPAGKEVVAAQARDRVAGQEKDEAIADAPETGRAAR